MITSTANEQVRRIRKLQESKERDASGYFYLEGLRIVGEAFEAEAEIETLVVAPELLHSEFGEKLVQRQRELDRKVLEVSVAVFERLAMKEGPQGIAAAVRQTWFTLDKVTIHAGRPWVALESVADPGNLGTILRTNDGAGGEGVILLDQSTDPYDPGAVRASMGAIFAQKIVRATLDEFARRLHAQKVALIGTSDAAQQDYHQYAYPERVVVLMGSERQGLSRAALQLCDAVVSIPMLGKSDSLNLAVATGVVLYEMLNQRREKRPV
jgi:TrmH family RNA methyltransferase